MKSLLASVAVFALVGVAAQTFADDVVTTSGKAQQRKVMQECMKKQAAADSTMSKADIKKTCQDQMQAQKDANDKSSGAPAQ
jgi:uncharacterized membrane protein (DUF106 family)